MIFLKAVNGFLCPILGKSGDGGGEAGKGRGHGDAGRDGAGAELDGVACRLAVGLGGVDDPVDLALVNEVDHVWPPARDPERRL